MFMRYWVALSMLVLAASAGAQSRGDWVLAQWQGGAYWFPGVVESRTNDTITVIYDDGTRETLSTRRVKPYDWKVKTRVDCRWAAGKTWYSGTISKIDSTGTKLSIAYDDGDRETTTTAYCRSS